MAVNKFVSKKDDEPNWRKFIGQYSFISLFSQQTIYIGIEKYILVRGPGWLNELGSWVS